MRINTKFSVAVHTLLLIATSPEESTSAWIAGSVNTNPVVIRKIVGLLQKGNLLGKTGRKTGYELVKSPEQITLLEIYRAVAVTEAEQLFDMHENPNVKCRVGASIQFLLEGIMSDAQTAMEAVLSNVRLQHLIDELPGGKSSQRSA